jgi:hypothetical protein
MRLQVCEPILLFTPFVVALDRGGDGIQKILISRAPSWEYRHVRN